VPEQARVAGHGEPRVVPGQAPGQREEQVGGAAFDDDVGTGVLVADLDGRRCPPRQPLARVPEPGVGGVEVQRLPGAPQRRPVQRRML
jgi:hypothetical protein